MAYVKIYCKKSKVKSNGTGSTIWLLFTLKKLYNNWEAADLNKIIEQIKLKEEIEEGSKMAR